MENSLIEKLDKEKMYKVCEPILGKVLHLKIPHKEDYEDKNDIHKQQYRWWKKIKVKKIQEKKKGEEDNNDVLNDDDNDNSNKENLSNVILLI